MWKRGFKFIIHNEGVVEHGIVNRSATRLAVQLVRRVRLLGIRINDKASKTNLPGFRAPGGGGIHLLRRNAKSESEPRTSDVG